MKAEIDAVCPKCGHAELRETILPYGAKRHECGGACAYLMVWKPIEEVMPTHEPN